MSRTPTKAERERVEDFVREQFGPEYLPMTDEDVMGWVTYWEGLAKAIGISAEDPAFRKTYSS